MAEMNFFFISFHYGISIQQQTQLTGGWANTCISEKGVSDSQGSKPNTVVSFTFWLRAKKIHLLLTKIA